MGATRFNLPGRYGTIWNASVPSPLSMLSFDNYGASRGAEFNSEFGFLALSSNDTAKSTLISLHNPTGQAGRVVSAGATVSIESTSDARLKRDTANQLRGYLRGLNTTRVLGMAYWEELDRRVVDTWLTPHE